MHRLGTLFSILTLAVSGCALDRRFTSLFRQRDLPAEQAHLLQRQEEAAVIAASFVTQAEPPPEALAAPEAIPLGLPVGILRLEQVIESVNRSYPLLEAAYLSRDIASGDHLAAHGAFDLKFKGASENGPLGFYETYRQRIGIEQPLYGGASTFAGYRVGRGQFQPWYLERQTNEGGEFNAGLALPLFRNVDIDERRAQLWRTELGLDLAEPEIRLQRLDFVRAASYAYWDWVASGRRYQIASSLLRIAADRNEAIRRRVETGDTEPPVLQDNRRLIVSREAKQIDANRKLQQSAIKLSLFLRDERGETLVPDVSKLADFPMPEAPRFDAADADIQEALANRPELRAMDLLRQQLDIDFAEARNDLLPDLQAVVAASQDVGTPATVKNDKSRLELDAGLFLDVPLQRRKTQGKMRAIEGKQQQLAAKARMTADKIAADVQAVHAALLAAVQQVERARESAELANRLAEIERRKFELGESDLLSVNLREQQAAEAQSTEVDALSDYFLAAADNQAIMARDANGPQ